MENHKKKPLLQAVSLAACLAITTVGYTFLYQSALNKAGASSIQELESKVDGVRADIANQYCSKSIGSKDLIHDSRSAELIATRVENGVELVYSSDLDRTSNNLPEISMFGKIPYVEQNLNNPKLYFYDCSFTGGHQS